MLRLMGSQRVGHDGATELNYVANFSPLVDLKQPCVNTYMCLYL